ncbi:MAG: hypothetical protein AAGD14_19895 [Planctomycetota bacterium]
MKTTATQPSLELQFADFLDAWGADWRYEARWPHEECGWSGDAPDFRVWLPAFHPARWKLGKVFYLRVGAPVMTTEGAPRDLASYTVAPVEEDGEITGFLFFDGKGRVSLRAPWRAD